MPQENELQKFLDDNSAPQQEGDILDQPLNPAPAEAVVTPEADEEETPKNRRERRLREKLQAEREANIAMSARLQALSEAQQFRGESTADHLKMVERIYGTNSPEANEATELLKTALKTVEDKATERALEMFRQEQRQAAERVREEEQRLEQMVDAIEDEHNVTFTKDMEKGFFKLMEKMSPKDSDGNITAYADPHAVWEIYQEKINKGADVRAKSLASRSMTQSGGSSQTSTQDDALRRVLRENGIVGY